jgi:hypothetical protein
MSVTGSGCLSLPLTNLEALLASLQAVQSFCGVAGEDLGQPEGVATAATHIYICQFDEPDEAAAKLTARPVLLIGWDEPLSALAEDTGSAWARRGSLWLLFEDLARNGSGPATDENAVASRDAIITLSNSAGAILEALEAAVAAGGTMDLLGWKLIDPPARMAEEDVAAGALDLVTLRVSLTLREG